MKSVLISIRPEWIQKIFSGEKTIEIRKTRPKIDTPFRCYIYCTMPDKRLNHKAGCMVVNTDELFRLPDGTLRHDWSGVLMTWPSESWNEDNFLNGKVIGEFICGKISQIPANGPLDVCCGQLKGTAMSREEFESYLGWGGGYGWHISDLKVYDKPKPLSDFKRWCGDGKWETLESLKRAPQSWCYVDGGLIG